jgi:hypothetical protein
MQPLLRLTAAKCPAEMSRLRAPPSRDPCDAITTHRVMNILRQFAVVRLRMCNEHWVMGDE